MNLQQIIQTNNYQEFLPEWGISDECLYVYCSRQKVSGLSVKHAATMMLEAIEMDRYCNEYLDFSGNKIKEGIDSCIGPEGFDKELLDNSPIGPISYETLLILTWIMQMNESLKSHGISTVQSQPAYYENYTDPNFESYFSVPFVDFAGPIEALGIYQQMESDTRLSNCFFNTFYVQSKKSGKVTIRFCIMRPYINTTGQANSGFSDIDFWETICTVCAEFVKK